MELGQIAATDKGRWKTAPLSAPLTTQTNDTIEIEGDTAWLKRNGHYIDSRTIGQASDYTPVPLSGPHTFTDVIFFRKDPMPAAAVTLTNVSINQSSGVVLVDFSDGNQLEFTDFEAMVNSVKNYDEQTEHAKNLLLLALIRRSPDGRNMDALNGSSCTIDGIAATPVQFSLVE